MAAGRIGKNQTNGHAFMADQQVDLGDLVQRGYRFALSLTHDAARAEDLVQDAWHSLLKANGTWTRPYLFAAVKSRFIDQCRRDGRVVFEALDESSAEMNRQVNGDASAHGGDHLVSVNGQFGLALDALRPEERGTLYLSAVEGASATEIAEMLGLPRGTVLSLMHRGKAKLRKAILRESDKQS